jgi:hypothetical protein
MRTFSLTEAAAFLRMHPKELRRRAKTGAIPGAKAGRAWVFIDEDLAAYLRSLYPERRQALQVSLGKELNECHSSDAVRRGGSTSPHHAASALEVLLAQTTRSRRRNSTTS